LVVEEQVRRAGQGEVIAGLELQVKVTAVEVECKEVEEVEVGREGHSVGQIQVQVDQV
jgi:hypothetical protein